MLDNANSGSFYVDKIRYKINNKRNEYFDEK